jgi:hypothetical protein
MNWPPQVTNTAQNQNCQGAEPSPSQQELSEVDALRGIQQNDNAAGRDR